MQISSARQLKKTRMGKRLCKVHEADNIDIAKTLVFKSQPYISGDEKLEIVVETIVRSSLYEEGETLHSRTSKLSIKIIVCRVGNTSPWM